jgi:hypothetical protein
MSYGEISPCLFPGCEARVYTSSGPEKAMRISLKKLPNWKPLDVDSACGDLAETAKLNGPEGCLQHPTGPDHRRSEQETASMADTSQYPDSVDVFKTGVSDGGAR